MANRVIRDWTKSKKINSITVHAERFFTRLIMKVDDYGRLYSDVRLLKADLYPLLLDSIREADISRWMAECQKAGLIILYDIKNEGYLQIEVFEQSLRRMKSKYPPPPPEKCNSLIINECGHPPSDVRSCPPETESETNPETESETGNYLRLREKIFKIKVSDYLKENFKNYLNVWEMNHRDIPIELVFKKMDEDYVCYTFTGERHLQNAFKSCYEKLLKEKKFNNGTKPTNTEAATRF